MTTQTQSIQEKFEALREEQRVLRDKFRTSAQQNLKELFREFFDLNPAIQAVTWTQYTPYFNDGDECVFGVNNPTFTNSPNAEDVCWGEYDGGYEDIWAFEGTLTYYLKNDARIAEVYKNGGFDMNSIEYLQKLLTSSDMEDILKEMFDNHVRVVATRDGFDVDEYDHD